ncbi:alpha/beta hydrolase [Streptomyces sp. NPDC088387]|uniref:alpha/beta hydrolase n=1 Tax=Streptomyces sp. NPDC088387 TaxID=3365859 RepID=UPI0038204BFA
MTQSANTPRAPELEPLVAPWIEKLGAALDALEAGRFDDLAAAREAYADWFVTRFPAPDGVTYEDYRAHGVPATRVRPDDTLPGRVLLYLHGGGYLAGEPRGYRGLVGRYARGLWAEAVIPDYRLAPDARYPAAIDDNLAVYESLLKEGYDAGSIVVSGDSAGGAMAVALLVAARDAGLPLPAAAVAISPWANLEHTGASIVTKAEADPLCTPEALRTMAASYLGDNPLNSPLASPVFADVSGLPPVLIQVGEREIMLSDAVRLAEHLAAAQVRVNLEVWPGMPHVWHLFSEDLKDADAALESAVGFLDARLPKA